MKLLSFFETSLAIQAVVVERQNKNFIVKEKYNFITEKRHSDFKQWINSSQLLQNLLLTAALYNPSLFLKKLTIPFKKQSDIQKILPIEIESIFPTPISELTIHTASSSENNKEATTVYIQAFPTRVLDEFMVRVIEQNIEPTVITSAAQALWRYSISCCSDKSFISIDSVGSEIHIVTIENKKLVQTFAIKEKDEQKMLQELIRIFYHLKKSFHDKCFILCLLPKRLWKEIETVLSQTLEIEFLDAEICNPELFRDRAYSLSIGAAIDALACDKNSVDFSRKTSIEPILRKMAKIGGIFSLMALVFMLSLFGNLFREKQLLEKDLRNLISGHKEKFSPDLKMNKPFFSLLSETEKELMKRKKQSIKIFPTTGAIISKLSELCGKEKVNAVFDEISYEIIELSNKTSSKKKKYLSFSAHIKTEPLLEKQLLGIEKMSPKEWKELKIKKNPSGYEISFIVE